MPCPPPAQGRSEGRTGPVVGRWGMGAPGPMAEAGEVVPFPHQRPERGVSPRLAPRTGDAGTLPRPAGAPVAAGLGRAPLRPAQRNFLARGCAARPAALGACPADAPRSPAGLRGRARPRRALTFRLVFGSHFPSARHILLRLLATGIQARAAAASSRCRRRRAGHTARTAHTPGRPLGEPPN